MSKVKGQKSEGSAPHTAKLPDWMAAEVAASIQKGQEQNEKAERARRKRR